MKKILFATCLLLSSLAQAAPKLVWAPIDYLYVPRGFDNNDSVEVVVTGFFPSPCYSRNTVKVDVVKDQIKVQITALLSDDHFKWCPDMLVPYTETVAIGNLQAGDYKISVNDKTLNYINDTMTIQESSSNSVNDHIYASVQSVERKGDTNAFILKASEYTDCYALDRVEFFDNNKDTISILPIMKKVKKLCPFKGRIVEYPITVDFTNMKVDRPLLHVRTMDGKSVNSVVYMGDKR